MVCGEAAARAEVVARSKEGKGVGRHVEGGGEHRSERQEGCWECRGAGPTSACARVGRGGARRRGCGRPDVSAVSAWREAALDPGRVCQDRLQERRDGLGDVDHTRR